MEVLSHPAHVGLIKVIVILFLRSMCVSDIPSCPLYDLPFASAGAVKGTKGTAIGSL